MGFAVSHVKSVTVADWAGVVTVANSTGGTTTANGSDLARPSDWNSVHKFGVETGFWEPVMPIHSNSSLSTNGIGTWYLHPMHFPHGLDSGQLNIVMADAAGFLGGTPYSYNTSGSVSRYQTLHNMLALYKRGSGASSTRLDTIWSSNFSILATWERRVSGGSTVTVSNYLTLSYPSQWDAAGGVTYGTITTSGTRSTSTTTSGTFNSTFADTLITGAIARVSGSRFMPFGFNISVEPDQYWLAHAMWSTSSSTGTNYSAGTMFSTQSRMHLMEAPLAAYKLFGQSVSNTSSDAQRWHGFVNTTSSAPFASLGTSDIRPVTTTGRGRLYLNYQKTTY
jgi:hypothetical protein